MTFIDKILQIVKSYLGEQEIQPNSGFKNPGIDKAMRSIGFLNGQSWCAYAVMLVLFQVYAGTTWLPLIKKYCSAATQEMWANFKRSKEFVTGLVPKLGAIVVWEEGNGAQGHTGLVTCISEDGKTFKSIEGNSNSDGSRNGYEWAENTHTVGLPHKDKGLNLLGFIYMPQI
jgi:hypothetical protein